VIEMQAAGGCECSPTRRWRDPWEYVDWSEAKRVKLPNLKPSTRTISIRMPETLIEDLKLLANKRDVHYQLLLKVYVAERVEQELRQ
jgi:predicted DNA binding CopG/RHH family protein